MRIYLSDRPADDGGIRVDLKGNIYVGMGLLPKGFAPPAGFETASDYLRLTGSVVKYGSQGGAVLGIVDSKSEDAGAPKLETTRNGVTIEGGRPPRTREELYNPSICCRGTRRLPEDL